MSKYKFDVKFDAVVCVSAENAAEAEAMIRDIIVYDLNVRLGNGSETVITEISCNDAPRLFEVNDEVLL